MRYARKFQRGFTLIEMVVVIVITGILGGMVALLLNGPVQGYVDSARRADMADVADLATSRMVRDLRLALPNSVRIASSVAAAGTIYYLEFIPTTDGARYDDFVASGVIASFNVLGAAQAFVAGASVVAGSTTTANAYAAANRATVISSTLTTPATVTIDSTVFPPSSPPENRLQIIAAPVTYVCAPDAVHPQNGAIIRYWGYAIQTTQPTSGVGALPLASSAVLASDVRLCRFDAPAAGLVNLYLTIAKSDENKPCDDPKKPCDSISLYGTAHVANQP